jgi:hypothetical protein
MALLYINLRRTRSRHRQILTGSLGLKPKRCLLPLAVIFIAVPSPVADEIKVEASIASDTGAVQVRAFLGAQDFGVSRPGEERVLHVGPVLVLVDDFMDVVTLYGQKD